MTTQATGPANPQNLPLLPRERLMSLLACETRLTILKEICTGEPIGVGAVAKLVGCTGSAASKQMRTLVEAGLCVQGRGLFYRIAPRYQVAPDAPKALDLGHCVVRLDIQDPK